jgi:hypothetical protein
LHEVHAVDIFLSIAGTGSTNLDVRTSKHISGAAGSDGGGHKGRQGADPAGGEAAGRLRGHLPALRPRQRQTLAITFWETEEDMRTSEKAALGGRTESAEVSGDVNVGVERYEVALRELNI